MDFNKGLDKLPRKLLAPKDAIEILRHTYEDDCRLGKNHSVAYNELEKFTIPITEFLQNLANVIRKPSCGSLFTNKTHYSSMPMSSLEKMVISALDQDTQTELQCVGSKINCISGGVIFQD